MLGLDGLAAYALGALIMTAGVLVACIVYWLLVGAGVWSFPFEKYEGDVDLEFDSEDNFTSSTSSEEGIPMTDEETRAALLPRLGGG